MVEKNESSLNSRINPNKKTENQEKDVLSYLRELVFGIVGVLLVLMLVFRVVVVSGPSMMETLYNGDCLLVLGNVFYSKPEYGDIIVVSKDSFKDGEPIIKRVIASEGQKIDIDFEKGIVFVDDQPLDESYVRTPTNLFEGISFPLVVDDGCYFVMGDNRNDSKDSRSVEIGLIDSREILGRAVFLLIPAKDESTHKRDFTRIGALW